MSAGGKCCVADNRFGIRVGVMGIEIDNAFIQKITEALFAHAVDIAANEIAAKLVDSDLKDKPGK
jgi:hypothetical protein